MRDLVQKRRLFPECPLRIKHTNCYRAGDRFESVDDVGLYFDIVRRPRVRVAKLNQNIGPHVANCAPLPRRVSKAQAPRLTAVKLPTVFGVKLRGYCGIELRQDPLARVASNLFPDFQYSSFRLIRGARVIEVRVIPEA